MRLTATAPTFNPQSFVLYPTELFAAVMPLDERRAQELYREAYEQAQAVFVPPVTERLAPIWN